MACNLVVLDVDKQILISFVKEYFCVSAAMHILFIPQLKALVCQHLY